MVTPGRFELPTRSLGNCCSIHLSYGATLKTGTCQQSWASSRPQPDDGVLDRARTRRLRPRRRTARALQIPYQIVGLLGGTRANHPAGDSLDAKTIERSRIKQISTKPIAALRNGRFTVNLRSAIRCLHVNRRLRQVHSAYGCRMTPIRVVTAETPGRFLPEP